MSNIEKKIEELDRKKDKSRVRIKSIETRDALQRVFDERTINLLQKMLNNRKITQIIGIISQGKEANVFFAYGPNKLPIAIKIYKIDIQSARWMKNYIIGDPRFKKIGSSPDKIIFTWCKKEYRNLKQMHQMDLECPEPFHFKANILIMSFIGNHNGTPARRLKDCVNNLKDPRQEMQISLQFIKDLYQEVKLVHGDFSEFNILYYEKTQYVIDVSQSVSKAHPKALFLLSRDIKNICKFYNKIGLETPDPRDIYYEIIN